MLRVRMSEQEHETLKWCADKKGTSKSEVVREGVQLIYEALTDGK